MIETLLSSDLVFKGKFLKIIRDKVLQPKNNKVSFREYIKHPGASLILAENEKNQILMLRQYRHSMKQVYYELPAGRRDEGEDPLKTAHREFEEETGYRAAVMSLMTEIHPCIGYADEIIWLYYAKNLTFVGAKPDESEDLQLLYMSWHEIEQKIKNNEIKDAKTLIALLWFQRFLQK